MVLKRESIVLGLLFTVFALLGGSQAFFAPSVLHTIADTASRMCGAIGTGSAWSCDRWESHGTRCSRRRTTEVAAAEGTVHGWARLQRRRGAGPLRMNYLEEVPESLVDQVLALEEEVSGRVLECYAERFAIVDGRRYLAAFTKDPAVAVAFEENGEVAPVPLQDPLMEELFPLAEACVKDLGAGVTLLRTPATLTVQGLDDLQGVPDMSDFEINDKGPNFYDDDDDDDDDEGGEKALTDETDGEEDEGEEEEEEEDPLEALADEVELLGEFLLEDEEFLLVRFLEPVLILAKETEDGRFVILDEEEDQDANPIVENLLSAEAL